MFYVYNGADMSSQAAASDPLGLPGFTFADLHRPGRLHELYDRFTAEVADTEPELWQQWTQYREIPDSLSPISRGNLIVQMAPHVSRFVTRLFCVGPEAEALRAATAAYDDLFRFKIDFVRRRALPLLKGGSRVEAAAADHAFVASLIAPFTPEGASVPVTADAEMALARAGCRLLDREEAARTGGTDAEKAAVGADIDTLKRWVAAHVHHPGYRDWVVFRFPETLDAEHLVRVQRSGPSERSSPDPTGRCAAGTASR
jgi:hypothetical protein